MISTQKVMNVWGLNKWKLQSNIFFDWFELSKKEQNVYRFIWFWKMLKF